MGKAWEEDEEKRFPEGQGFTPNITRAFLDSGCRKTTPFDFTLLLMGWSVEMYLPLSSI